MAKSADNNFDEEPEVFRPDQTTPRTPWLLWVVVFLIVVLMVIWSIRKFGTRSSAATAGSQPINQPVGAQPAS